MSKRAKIITVTARKGGSTKTSTCWGLGNLHADNNKKVLFIDFDSQSNLSLTCNVAPVSLQDFKNGVIYSTPNKNIDILPSTKHFGALEHELLSNSLTTNIWLKETLFNALPLNDYDYIIIDTPPSLNCLNVNCLVACDLALVALKSDIYNLTGLQEVEEIIQQVKTLNPTLQHEIILNCYEDRLTFSKMMIKGLNEFSAFNGITIPKREHVTTSIAYKKSYLDRIELKESFEKIGALI